MKKPNYGIDAPGLVRFFFAAGIVAGLACIATIFILPGQQFWAYLYRHNFRHFVSLFHRHGLLDDLLELSRQN